MEYLQKRRIWFLIMALFLSLGSAVAQKMKVESFYELTQSADPDAKDPTFRRESRQSGRSGKFCAIIKIVTTVQDKAFTFDLGTDLTPEGIEYKQNNEIWVYVPIGTNKIKISHKRFGQLDTHDGYYHFTTVGVKKCKEATVYRLRLYTDFNPDEDIIKDDSKLATVKFKINPHQQSTIQLRKVPELTDSTGVFTKRMPLGVYHYRVSTADYHDYDGIFELSIENEIKEVDVFMHQAFGWLTLTETFDTTDCTFAVDGMTTNASAIKRMKLSSGSHSVSVGRPKYSTLIQTVQIKDSVVSELNPQLEPIVGYLNVTTNVSGAMVKIDGKEVGHTPLNTPCKLIIGKHTVELSCSNYRTENVTVDIKAGETMELSKKLVDIALFSFYCTPRGAHLYINGEYKGTTPCKFDYGSGNYMIKLSRKKYKTFEKSVYLDSSNPEQTFKLVRQHQQKTSFYLQPTFQCGALTAIGGEVGGYVSNINIEAMYLVGTAESDKIFWNRPGYNYIDETFAPTVFGVKAGYGIIIGRSFRITPQIGFSSLSVKGSEGSSCGATSCTLSLRAEYAICSNIGLSLTPEYGISLKRTDLFTKVSEVLPELNEWSEGFNLRLGAYVFF